ncbi:MAG: FHA domain-containing protein [Polyangiaceae bacterium]
MDIHIGVACGRCDRYNALGSPSCVCGQPLVLGPRSLRSEAPKPAVQAAAPRPDPAGSGANTASADPLSLASLFGKGALKPRRSAQMGGMTPAASFVPVGATRPAQATDSAVFSSGLDKGAVPRARPGAPGAEHDPSVEELMEQARNYVCRSCSTPVPIAHKFCGRCGAAIPPEILNFRTQFFGQLQTPGKAKLVLIRGEGVEGLSYQLNAEQHVLGRNGQIAFPDDVFVSPRHANLLYRGGKLVARDEGSLNGVYWRIHGSVELSPGDCFLTGEQLFRIEGPSRPNDGPAPDGTYFYTSPKHQAEFKLCQVVEGGSFGMAVCARGNTLQIGREGCDLNFPSDLYMSAAHCRVETNAGKLTLTDLDSRNGTYVRLKAGKELANGDYLFIGRKLLRVEITAS